MFILWQADTNKQMCSTYIGLYLKNDYKDYEDAPLKS